MNVSLNWLKEYVDLEDDVSIQQVVDRLTMTGSKVEKYEEFGKKTEKVYTAKVIEVSKHEQDEKISVLKLDMDGKVLTAVAKIPDIEVGDIVPVALEGAKIIGKEVKKATIMGVESECMVCHILDLGLDLTFPWVKPSGLLVFPDDVKLGEDVSKILGLGDYIIEFEITPNRPDCLSVEGLAYELAITFNKKCKQLWQNIKPNFNVKDNVCGLSVKVETDNCKRYTMNVAKNVTVKPSPYEMQLKLIKCGIRPINNIVDITNYVMLEVGEPLHAFDRQRLNSNEIVVRQATDKEVLETLDGIERKLDSTNMVITNGKEPVAIAGVMGGELSGINNNTNEVVIESANFVRASIRNTSKKFALRTDASSRYEKGLPQELTIHALNRVCDLINKTKSGIIEDNIVDIYNDRQEQNKINIDCDKINSIIGTKLSKKEIYNILENIGISIIDDVAYVPYNRIDLELNEDLAEEVARIYGYDKLPSTLPNSNLTFGEKTLSQKLEDKVTELSQACGFNEIYTYTFFSKDLLSKMGVNENSLRYNCVKVLNPLSKDFEFMRTTATPSMLEALERNYTKKNLSVKLFELGKVFLDADNIKRGELVTEDQTLTLGMYDEHSDFYDIKEAVENILEGLRLLNNEYEISRIDDKVEYHPGISAKLCIAGNVIAEFGKLSPKIRENYMLPENTYIATIYFSTLQKYIDDEIKFVELPKFPAVERDIAFVIDEDVLAFNIEKELKNIEYIESIKLFDVYQGKQIEQGKKSMAYSIFLRSDKKTLAEEDINKSMNSVIEVLKDKFGATIRK